MTLNAQATEPGTPSDSQGMAIVARTQGQMVRRRFFRHRAALAGMIIFGFVIVLAFSSIGFAGIPGWWDKTYLDTGPLTNQGRPTLSLIPEFLGGTGIHLGEHPFGQDDIGIDYFALTMR